MINFVTKRIAKTGLSGVAVAIAMFGFGYAMVPLYYKFCVALGIDVASVDIISEVQASKTPLKTLRVEFDANSHNDLIAMSPEIRKIQLDTGTAYKITYTITNLTDDVITGRAVPAYNPQRAARWVKKLHCFCFDELTLAPGEIRKDPVVFIIDRDLPDDVNTVSLSYTFFPTGQFSNKQEHMEHGS